MLMIALAVVWWTIAVVMLSWALFKFEPEDPKALAYALCLSVLWPLTLVVIVPMIIYDTLVLSTKRIRNDLKNRGILRQFEAWLEERNK